MGRPAVLGRGHAAAARRAVAGPRRSVASAPMRRSTSRCSRSSSPSGSPDAAVTHDEPGLVESRDRARSASARDHGDRRPTKAVSYDVSRRAPLRASSRDHAARNDSEQASRRPARPRRRRALRRRARRPARHGRWTARPVADWFHAAGGAGGVPAGRVETVTQALEPGTYYVVGGGGPADDPASFAVTGDGARSCPRPQAAVEGAEYAFSGDVKSGGRRRRSSSTTSRPTRRGAARPDLGRRGA